MFSAPSSLCFKTGVHIWLYKHPPRPNLCSLVHNQSPDMRQGPFFLLFGTICGIFPTCDQYPVFSVRPLLLFGFTAPLAGFLSFLAHLSATGTSHCPFFFLFSSIWRMFVCLNPPSPIPLPASPPTTTHHPTLP